MILCMNAIYSHFSSPRRWPHKTTKRNDDNNQKTKLMNMNFSKEVGDIWLFTTLVPKVFIFVGSTTLWTFIDYDWLVHLVECPNVSTTYCNLHKG